MVVKPPPTEYTHKKTHNILFFLYAICSGECGARRNDLWYPQNNIKSPKLCHLFSIQISEQLVFISSLLLSHIIVFVFVLTHFVYRASVCVCAYQENYSNVYNNMRLPALYILPYTIYPLDKRQSCYYYHFSFDISMHILPSVCGSHFSF